MPTIEERVALLEQQMTFINNWIDQVVNPAITDISILQSLVTDLTDQVAALNSRMQVVETNITDIQTNILNLQTDVSELQSLVTDLSDKVIALDHQINGGAVEESILDRITDLVNSLSNLTTGNRKLIAVLMSYANQRLLSPKNPNADSALWVNLKGMAGD